MLRKCLNHFEPPTILRFGLSSDPYDETTWRCMIFIGGVSTERGGTHFTCDWINCTSSRNYSEFFVDFTNQYSRDKHPAIQSCLHMYVLITCHQKEQHQLYHGRWPASFTAFGLFFPTEVHPLQTFLLWQRSPRKLRLGSGRCDEEFVFPWVCPRIWLFGTFTNYMGIVAS